MTSTRRWMAAKELAAELGIHPATLRRLARQGVIPAIRIGGAIRFRPEAVEAALEARARKRLERAEQ